MPEIVRTKLRAPLYRILPSLKGSLKALIRVQFVFFVLPDRVLKFLPEAARAEWVAGDIALFNVAYKTFLK
jgi:hypothetical protein